MKQQLEDWLNVPSIMETEYGRVEGTVKYGIRLPIKPGDIPLKECKPESKEKVKGETAKYWFVNDNQTIKVRLITKKQEGDKLVGLAYDTVHFKYVIKRK